MTKICKKCKQERDISFYYEREISKDGYRHVCKVCDSERHKKRYWSIREVRLSQHKEWIEKKGGREILQQYYIANKAAYKKRGQRFRQVDKNKRVGRQKQWKSQGIIKKDGSFFNHDDFDKEFLKCKGLCNICGSPEIINKPRISVDHDHNTGYYRGLLCRHCNQALGFFKDDDKNLRKAIKYLKKHNGI